MIILHPVINQLALGRVYTRKLVNQELYVQHYQVAVELIESYQLKPTSRNLSSKGSTKYTCTTDTSTISKYSGCQLHNDHYLTEANQRARRNFRDTPTCIFKQQAALAQLLPIKAHQLYQDVILLKHHLADLLPQYDPSTNHFSLQTQSQQDQASDNIDLQRNLDSPVSYTPPIDLIVHLIEQIVDSSELTHKLKAIAVILREDRDLQFFTDSSL